VTWLLGRRLALDCEGHGCEEALSLETKSYGGSATARNQRPGGVE